ncbi:hypothetical protein EG832_21115, partial [bacterium]|nr:hypothetical protein [bacterium]
LLFLGGIGTGKTTAINHMIRGVRSIMSQKDVMVIFDAKGDYLKNFYREGDIVISNDASATHSWNVFEEIKIDERIEENILEITKYLFSEKLKKSSQPFFPNAAKDVLGALFLHLIRFEEGKKYQNNQSLREIVDRISTADFKRILKSHEDLGALISYIDNETSGQTLGVLSELQQAMREVFVGNFKKKGDFSIRKAIKQKQGKVIFIEYDLGIGKTLAPIYGLIIDLAIKEALCRREDEGNVYFVLDEFRLLTPLEHFDNGVNFGRSLGAKFIAGIQNVEQIYDSYGVSPAKSILSGFSTEVSFRLSDESSIEFTKKRAGESIKRYSYEYQVATKGLFEELRNGSAIEDWD